MNIDVLMTNILLVMAVVIVGIVIYSTQDYISAVDEKVDDLKQGYVPLKKHVKDIDESRKEDAVLHDRINYTNEKINKSFDGNYDNLKNKPNLFDGDYKKLKNKPSDTGDYNKLINKPRLFDGEYGSLKNKPTLFDGDYNNLENKPALFEGDYNNLENKPALFEGDYNNLTNVPTTFASNWSNIDDKPSKFPSNWDMIDGKPSNFANTWNNINEKPDHYPSKWDMIDDKPNFASSWDNIEGKPITYDSTWDKVQDKPQEFPTSWDLITGKPTDTSFDGEYNNLKNKPVLFDGEYDNLKNKPVLFDKDYNKLINKPASFPTNWNDVHGKPDSFSTKWDLIEEKPDDFSTRWDLIKDKPLNIINSEEYNDTELRQLIGGKTDVGHKHNVGDINNLESTYATKAELTSIQPSSSTDIEVKNINANGKVVISEATGTPRNKNGGTLTLKHENVGGHSSIVFLSRINRTSDYGYINYQDDRENKNNKERSVLTIGVENDGRNSAQDSINLKSKGGVGIGTDAPTQALDVVGNIKLNNGLFMRGGSPTLYLQDTSHRSSMIHCNSNKLYFLRGSEKDSTKWEKVKGRWPLELNLENNDAVFGGHIHATGGQIYTGNAVVMRGSSPTLYLQDTNHRSSMIHCHSNKLYFLRGSDKDSRTWKTTKGRWPLELHLENNNAVFGGDISAAGNITAYFSDQRLKTKISKINNPLKIINSLNGFYYKPNEIARQNGIANTDTEIGLSAQEVQKVLPELVKLAPFDRKQDADGKTVSKSGQNYLTLSYERLVPVLVESVKELTKQNTDLQQKYDLLLQDMINIKQKLNLM